MSIFRQRAKLLSAPRTFSGNELPGYFRKSLRDDSRNHKKSLESAIIRMMRNDLKVISKKESPAIFAGLGLQPRPLF